MDSALAVINIIPFVLSLLIAIPAVKNTLKQTGLAWTTAGVMALLFFWLLTYLPRLTDEPYIELAWNWVPELGLTLAWYVDGLGLLFSLVVTGVGFVVFLYAGYYLEDLDELARFYVFFAAFAGAMLAVVTAGNVISLFIAWELTSVTSFLLIGFKGDKYADAREGASRALLITGGGGLAMLVGLLLMGTAVGSFEMRDILAATSLPDHPWYTAITLLVMLGCFTKSAQFPFHFWLPGAMSAPSPASAYLHSATMVKAGVFLLLRFYPPLGNTELWQTMLLAVGLATMFIGALFAIRQRDLKALLAYSTVSQLGALVALIGLPEGHGLLAALVGILAHAMYKGTLFLLAGTIEHSTGTRNLDELGGLRKHLPGVTLIAAIVGLSMAGVPPLLGFVAKEVLIDAVLFEGLGVIPVVIVFVSALLTTVVALLFVWDVFFSRPTVQYEHFHAPSLGLNTGPALLAVMSLFSALFIPQIVLPVITPAITGEFSLYLIPPYVNTALILSGLVMVFGPLLFAVRRFWLTMPWLNVRTGAQLYADVVRAVEWSGDQLLKTQGGKLRYYLLSILSVMAVMMFLGGYENLRRLDMTFQHGSTDLLKTMLLILSLGATLASIMLKHHLLAVLAMGVMGYAVGGLFLLEPAPDVALVQFLIETLATVLIILMIARISIRQREDVMEVLWKRRRDKTNFGLWRDAAISIVIGASVGLFALAAINDRQERMAVVEPIAEWHMANAYPETEATDVVAAILTDFRGTDTLLEITVFAMAALGVLTLLTLPEGTELLSGRHPNRVLELVTAAHAPEPKRQAVVEEPGDEVIIEAAEEGRQDVIEAVIDAEPDEIANPIVDVPPDDPALEALEDLRIPDKTDEQVDQYQYEEQPHLSTPLTRTVSRLVLPFAMLISFAHVLYGGSAPGDGFTAGVVSGLAVALWYVVFGYFEARRRLRWLHPGRLISLGLGLAVLNALAGIIFEDAFFNIYHLVEGEAPAGLHLTSSLIFELAVFLTVFGGVTTIMEAIAHPAEVEQEV